ncbi:type II toxin-antitoxin system RelE/ParE family toxin [Candidatus Micrarchaeota archaeon]|nr:type II toxin-antitoxin system RelE/ParE family toxin [Candidatus Micrarchaeota archaeon]
MQVLVHNKAQKKFKKIADSELKERLKDAFKLLSDPFSLDTIKIKGEEHTYRTRIGKYRILFIIEDKTVYIVDFDTRGKVYK